MADRCIAHRQGEAGLPGPHDAVPHAQASTASGPSHAARLAPRFCSLSSLRLQLTTVPGYSLPTTMSSIFRVTLRRCWRTPPGPPVLLARTVRGSMAAPLADASAAGSAGAAAAAVAAASDRVGGAASASTSMAVTRVEWRPVAGAAGWLWCDGEGRGPGREREGRESEIRGSAFALACPGACGAPRLSPAFLPTPTSQLTGWSGPGWARRRAWPVSSERGV